MHLLASSLGGLITSYLNAGFAKTGSGQRRDARDIPKRVEPREVPGMSLWCCNTSCTQIIEKELCPQISRLTNCRAYLNKKPALISSRN